MGTGSSRSFDLYMQGIGHGGQAPLQARSVSEVCVGQAWSSHINRSTQQKRIGHGVMSPPNGEPPSLSRLQEDFLAPGSDTLRIV